jgi:hypothetical protein
MLHNLLCFVLSYVISVSWPESRVWLLIHVDSGYFFSSFFKIKSFFFNFIFQHWINSELYFIIYFYLFYMRLSQNYDLDNSLVVQPELTRVIFSVYFYEIISRSHNPSHKFSKLAWDISGHFFPFLNWFFFSILLFNIGLIENWVL